MAKKTKNTERILTPQERHEELNACINCVFEMICEIVFPFPINLDECCEKYEKREFNSENSQQA